MLSRWRSTVITVAAPDHFICNCPLVEGSRVDSSLNWREGMAPLKGAPAPQGKVTMPKVSQDGIPKE